MCPLYRLTAKDGERETLGRSLVGIIPFYIDAGQSDIEIFPSAILLDIRRTAKY